jgi:hypothetical protein
MKSKLTTILCYLLLAACGGNVQGSKLKEDEITTIGTIFTDRYYNNYKDRYCGENILGFTTALTEVGVDLSQHKIVKITNEGVGSFGMVNAQSARSIRFNRPAAVELNWHHHVILLDELKGIVFDFDYMTSPTPVPIAQYIEAMYLDEPECAKPIQGLTAFCVGAKQKLDGYLWELSPVTSTSAPIRKTMREIMQSYSELEH